MVTIQELTTEEIPQVRELLKNTWHDTYGHIYSHDDIERVTDRWQSPVNLQMNIDDEKTYIAVAKEENEIVGMVTARQTGPKTMFLVRLYIHPGHQKKGIGSQLLDAAIAHFPGTEKVKLEVETNNPKGCAFYLKKGFRKTGEKTEVTEGVTMHTAVMEKELT